MGGFGEVIYDNQQAAATNGNGGGEAAAGQEVLALDDPQLLSESLTDNAEADAYAVPPPAPDGKWRAKLRAVPIKDKTTGQEKESLGVKYDRMNGGKPFCVTNIEVALIDLGGKYDGTKIIEYWVKTATERSGTSQAATILRKAGGTMPSPLTHASLMKALLDRLAGEPEVIVETYWEASCATCGEAAKKRGDKAPKPFLRGSHRFPQDKGQPVAEAKCPVCGGMCRAQVRVAQFFAVSETKATQGLG